MQAELSPKRARLTVDQGHDVVARAPTAPTSAPAKPITPRLHNANPELEVKNDFLEAPGRHNGRSPVVGSRAAELEAVRRAATPQLAQLSRALYSALNICLIPRALAAEADCLAYERFTRYLERYGGCGLTAENAVDWKTGGQAWTDTNNVADTRRWWIHSIVGTPLGDATHYLPRGLAALHELMHIEETRCGGFIRYDPIIELLTMAASLVEVDALYKQLTGATPETVIDYGRSVSWSTHRVPLGVLANRIRDLVAHHGTYGAAFASPPALGFLAGSTTL
jgi:hypothetical protein